MEKQLVFKITAIVFLLAGFLLRSSAVPCPEVQSEENRICTVPSSCTSWKLLQNSYQDSMIDIQKQDSGFNMSKVKNCDIQCPKINIPRGCLAEDFIVLDGTMCRSCDIDLCLILEWPPKVSVPYCPNSNCKHHHVPERCILRRFKKINMLTLCRDCDIDVCKRSPKTNVNTNTTNELKVRPLCPRLHCKLIGIPMACLMPSYEIINGQRCRRCDEDVCRHPPALRIYSKRHVRY